MDVLREIPIGSAPAENCSVGEFGLSGALSIGRFVVSRWHVCGGRGTMGIQSSVGVLCLAESRNWGRKWGVEVLTTRMLFRNLAFGNSELFSSERFDYAHGSVTLRTFLNGGLRLGERWRCLGWLI